MSLSIYQVDAFTDNVFKGNPAAVCISKNQLPETLMQNIANEMNLSETAFVTPLADKDDTFTIRWFTPTTEVKLCGHATLASAHIIFEQDLVTNNAITFINKDSTLELKAKKSPYGVALDFPVEELSIWSHKEKQALLSYLGLAHDATIYKGKITSQLLVETDSEKTVDDINPNFNRLKGLSEDYSGITVTAKSSNYDFVSRFFDPWEGIDEDPVTGSAHTLLAPYWGKKLEKRLMKAKQISKRSGVLYLELKNNRVHICGQAVTFLIGKLPFVEL